MSRKQINKRRKKDKKLWNRVKFEYTNCHAGHTVQMWCGGFFNPDGEFVTKHNVCVFKEKSKPFEKQVVRFNTFKEALISFEEEIRNLQCQSTNT